MKIERAPADLQNLSLRIFSMLKLRKKFSDEDIADVCGLAAFGLTHHWEEQNRIVSAAR